MLPGIIGGKADQIAVAEIERAATTVGLLGLLGLLYAGLGWLSAMRNALGVVFEQPAKEHPNFVDGKLRDLVTLLVLGVVLLLSVALAGFVTGFSDVVLDWLNLDDELGWLVTLIGRVIGFGANLLLFYRLLQAACAAEHAEPVAVVGGAPGCGRVRGAQGSCRSCCWPRPNDNPAFQAFGIALILLVWINYTSRGTLYAAAWAHTTVEAREIRDRAALERARMQELTRVDLHEAPPPEAASRKQGGEVVRGRRGDGARPGRRGPSEEGAVVKFERRHAVLLLAVAVWNVVTFGTFARNLWAAYESGEDRATGYWVAHTVLIVVNFAIAGLLGSLGWKALSAPSRRELPPKPVEPS